MIMDTLFRQLCSLKLLHRAWKMVKLKNSSGGIDGVSVAEFEDDLGEHLKSLQKELKERKWRPEPYLQIEIRKKKKETERRKLGLLTIKDKIVQQGIKLLIEPRFENLFVNNSYGYRPEKGHTRAIRRTLSEFQNKKNNWILQLDIDNYFDAINHDLLFARLKSIVPDQEVLRLTELCVKIGVVNRRHKWEDVTQGLPQGAVLSPLLANFYLHSFDQFITAKSFSYVRYADDFLILSRTREEAEELLVKARNFLEERLLLQCNEPVITPVEEGVEFLGVVVKREGISLSDKKKKDLEERIRSIELEGMFFSKKSLETLQGLHIYYGTLLPEEYLKEFDRILWEKLQELVRNNWRNFRNQQAVAECFKVIQFYSEESVLRKKETLSALIVCYADLKREDFENRSDENLNKRLIEQKKREYRKREGAGAELVVNAFGSFIGLNQKGLSVRQQGTVMMEVSAAQLEHITVMNETATISAPAIRYCMNNKIPVDFFDSRGKHYASVLNPAFVECTCWESQARMGEEKRCRLAAKIIYGKLKNQLHLIKYFHKYHKGAIGVLTEKYADVTATLNEYISRAKEFSVEKEDYREELMTLESAGAVVYWDYVRTLIADDGIGFETRERKGAKDLVNSLLNYGYAILYSRVWQALLLAKLNPTDSVIHVRQDHKPTLAYDLIELFRAQAVDRVVIALIQKKEPLEMEKDLLSEETKVLLVQNILERINRYEKYRGEEVKFADILIRQAKEMAEYITEDKVYKPYIAKW